MPVAAVTLATILIVSLAVGTWIWAGLVFTGFASLSLFRDIPVEKLLAPNIIDTATSEALLVLPLFILMAEILFRSKLSTLLFQGLTPISSRLPGQLLHANVFGCTLFAATCGSSAATTLTVGRVTYDELVSRGYAPTMVMGTLAGPGTLGLLIPPSTILIVYGVLSETSILKLFLSGFVPGILLALSFSAYVMVRTKMNTSLVPDSSQKFGIAHTLREFLKVTPVIALIGLIMGAMYFGIASPTETATFGVIGACLISVSQRTLTLSALREALKGTVHTTSMLGLIIAAAVFLSTAMGFLGIPQAVARLLEPFTQHPYLLIALLLVFYVILGCFLEGVSIIVMTLPIVLPLVIQAGFDPLWFGIFLVLVVEMAQITPPLGFNIFVLQSLTNEPLSKIIPSIVPFFLILVGFVVLITVFPPIAMLGK